MKNFDSPAEELEFRLHCYFKSNFYAAFGLEPTREETLAAAAACEKLALDLRRSVDLSKATGWPMGPFLPVLMFAHLGGIICFAGLIWCVTS